LGVIGHPHGHARCEAYWRAVAVFHKGKWPSTVDSAYSFGVCPHGVVFGLERGWSKRQYANGEDVVGPNDGPDSEWYTILGFFGVGEVPPGAMTQAARELIHQGRIRGWAGLAVLPHNAFKRKGCPGPEWTALAAEWNGRSFVPPDPDPVPATPAPIPREDRPMKLLYDRRTWQCWYEFADGQIVEVNVEVHHPEWAKATGNGEGFDGPIVSSDFMAAALAKKAKEAQR